MNRIEAVGLGKVYWDGDRALQVLKQVSLSVQAGEGISLLGPSGSGKTTLLNLLSGLDRPSEGSVLVGGTNLATLNSKERAAFLNRNVGFVFQFYHLLPELTSLENVMLPAMIERRGRKPVLLRRRAQGLLERMGLKDRMDHFPAELSGGEQQRTAIARALMNDPGILFCDEPTGNLDPERAKGIVNMLAEFKDREKKTIVVATHDGRLAERLGRVWEMEPANWQKSKVLFE